MSVLAIFFCSRPRARTGSSINDTTARVGVVQRALRLSECAGVGGAGFGGAKMDSDDEAGQQC